MAKLNLPPSRLPISEQPVFHNALITPELALEMLRGPGKRFRKMNSARVLRYVMDMQADSWKMTGDPIKFDVDGNLIDGQHRLQAIANSRIAMEAIVATNLPSDAFHAIDTGAGRSAGQLMAFLDVPSAGDSTAVWRWILDYNAHLHGETRGPVGGAGGRPWLTQAAVLCCREQHPEVPKSVQRVRELRGKRTVPQSIGAFVHYMGGRTSPEKADEFVDQIISEAGLERGGPVHTLLARVRDHRAARRTPDRIVVCWLTATAWRSFEDGVQKVDVSYRESKAFPRFACDDRPG
jgi:hypothetical protein